VAIPGDISETERAALRTAVEIAGRGAGTVLPNPVVGCVVLDSAGATAGEGFHQRAGGPHAEVFALAAAGERANGGTAVVTLEPCNHTGRTPPCSEALIAAGIARVVVAVRDPWRPAAGGIERLTAAGVDVVDLSGTADADAAERVNRVWLTATRLGRAYVTFKAGMTIDGRVAAADGTSRWITSEPSRSDVHRLRAEVDTMMVGIGTVLTDDPQLTARHQDGRPAGRQPLRVVVDSRGRTPSGARVLDDSAETLIATVAEFGGSGSGVDLAALLSALFERRRRHVLLEGGPRLAAAMIDAGLVDEVLIYQAPILLGAGTPVVAGGAVGTLADAHRFELADVTRFGPDVRLRWLRT
jgi:diaminohydroxyphosphoribosylaminopyrimidine deaminase/5-amino-6-(5-phosphoribosylamino)uracil reductase